MTRKLSRFLFLWLILLATVVSAVPATATPTDHPNTYVNTGDMRKDLIGVALTQVGYYEGANNDTKYGVWYGYNNAGWCGMFVAWCANQAGIPTSVIPKTGTTNPSDYNVTCRSGKEYRPQPGDLFFRKSGSSYAHVGIVYYLDGDYFYTLEGNTYWQGPEGVYIRCRLIADYDFGTPNYPDTSNHNYQPGYEAAHPHKEYAKCTHCGDKYYTGGTKTLADCRDCIVINCKHSYNSWSSSDSSQHARSCNKCGKIETAKHSWNSGTVVSQPSCSSDGEKIQTCTACNATRNATIAALAEHNYGQWKYLNAEQHTRICIHCAAQEVKTHSSNDHWDTDASSHWYDCSDCGGRAAAQPHDFGEGCNDTCQICQYVREDPHSYDNNWSYDSNGHWNICSLCQSSSPAQQHEFDGVCDSTCNTCAYTRPVSHTFSSQYMYDADVHRSICSNCGFLADPTPHSPGSPATEASPQVCTVCKAELNPVLKHIHTYQMHTQTLLYHSGVCDCGAETGEVYHSWDEETGSCSACGVSRSMAIVSIGLLILAGIMAIVFIPLLLIRYFKRKRFK